jgi:hypothetical protein
MQQPRVKPSEWLGVRPTVWIYRDHGWIGYRIAVGQNPCGHSAWAVTKWGARFAANRYRTGKRSALNAKRSGLRPGLIACSPRNSRGKRRRSRSQPG